MSVCLIIFHPRYITIVIDFTSPPSTNGEDDGGVFNPQMLRTFRVLRALKTVSIVPGTFPKCGIISVEYMYVHQCFHDVINTATV